MRKRVFKVFDPIVGEIDVKKFKYPSEHYYIGTKMDTLFKIVVDALNEFGVPFKIRGGSVHILAELDPESINENSTYYSTKYTAKNGTEIIFSYNLHGGTVLLEFKNGTKKKVLSLGIYVHFSLQDDRIIIKRINF
jgi:hypothetical protein